MQIHGETEEYQPFSTAICNECVLNINNFYTFKKKILDAQELIISMTDKNKLNKESNIEHIEYVEDDEMLQMIDLTEENQMLELENESTDESDKIIAPFTEQSPKQRIIPIIKVIKTQNIQVVKRRPNEPSNQKVANKKGKVDDTTEKVIIQMNECLICPKILGDILQLKDHIESHTDIKCKACKRQFARYSNLKRHFNATHSKPKPFQCDICGLGFNFSVNLQTHAALHYSGKIQSNT